jgi:iron complex transport system substrate-binding protein
MAQLIELNLFIGVLCRFFLSTVLFLLLSACDQTTTVPSTAGSKGPAQRIVSLSPHITELVFAAGAGEQLVGVVEYSDYPPAAASLPRVGDSARVDYETLALLQPDLVLGWESGNPVEIIERIRELGYRVILVEPEVLDSVAVQLETIGELAGTSNIADKRAAQLRKRIEKLSAMGDEEEILTVFWQISADPYFTVTGKHVISEIIELCGGQNIFADLPGLAPSVTLESVLTAQPDVIIASVSPAQEDLNQAWKDQWARWPELRAVKNRRLYSVNSDLVSRAGPRLVDGANQVCAAMRAARTGG